MEQFFGPQGFNAWFCFDMPVYHCEFKGEYYDDSLYDRFGIEFPNTLQRAVPKRKAEFLAGRYCAAKCLEELGSRSRVVRAGKNRCPIWPDSTIGSISHSGHHAIAIAVAGEASKAYGVGVDIESEVDEETVSRICRLVVSPKEMLLLSRDVGQKALLFTLAFSAKESFFKAAYPTVGFYFDFDAVSVEAFDFQRRALYLRINRSLHCRLPEGTLVRGLFHILPKGQVVTLVALYD